MNGFSVRTADLRALNSLTKYPSIPTYHALDPRNGGLLDDVVTFDRRVIGTEKVDGTNARMILLPDGSWLLGSREELLLAQGDLIGNPAQGIVAALRSVVEALSPVADEVRVLYVEVYGGKIGAAAKQYSSDPAVCGWRLFDVAVLPDYQDQLTWPSERISAWREDGGQTYLEESALAAVSAETGVAVTPRLFELEAAALPTGIEETAAFLSEWSPRTLVPLDDSAGGESEGIVLRSTDRSVIAKARFQDYTRTIKRRATAH